MAAKGSDRRRETHAKPKAARRATVVLATLILFGSSAALAGPTTADPPRLDCFVSSECTAADDSSSTSPIWATGYRPARTAQPPTLFSSEDSSVVTGVHASSDGPASQTRSSSAPAPVLASRVDGSLGAVFQDGTDGLIAVGAPEPPPNAPDTLGSSDWSGANEVAPPRSSESASGAAIEPLLSSLYDPQPTVRAFRGGISSPGDAVVVGGACNPSDPIFGSPDQPFDASTAREVGCVEITVGAVGGRLAVDVESIRSLQTTQNRQTPVTIGEATVQIDATPRMGEGCDGTDTACIDNNIAESAAAVSPTWIRILDLVDGPVQVTALPFTDGGWVHAHRIDIKWPTYYDQPYPDFVGYARYSDLDDDGETDVDEVNPIDTTSVPTNPMNPASHSDDVDGDGLPNDEDPAPYQPGSGEPGRVGIFETDGFTGATEGAAVPDFYTVALDSRPETNVLVHVSTETTGLPQIELYAVGVLASNSVTLLFTPDTYADPQRVFVRAIDDNVDESDLRYAIITHKVTGGGERFESISIDDTQVSVWDNDVSILSIEDVSLPEGNEGTVRFPLRIQLSTPADFPVAMDVVTEDGSAVAGLDYAHLDTHVVFEPGQLEHVVEIVVNGDHEPEADEFFVVRLQNVVTQGAVHDDAAVVTIEDDDRGPLTALWRMATDWL